MDWLGCASTVASGLSRASHRFFSLGPFKTHRFFSFLLRFFCFVHFSRVSHSFFSSFFFFFGNFFGFFFHFWLIHSRLPQNRLWVLRFDWDCSERTSFECQTNWMPSIRGTVDVVMAIISIRLGKRIIILSTVVSEVLLSNHELRWLLQLLLWWKLFEFYWNLQHWNQSNVEPILENAIKQFSMRFIRPLRQPVDGQAFFNLVIVFNWCSVDRLVALKILLWKRLLIWALHYNWPLERPLTDVTSYFMQFLTLFLSWHCKWEVFERGTGWGRSGKHQMSRSNGQSIQADRMLQSISGATKTQRIPFDESSNLK